MKFKIAFTSWVPADGVSIYGVHTLFGQEATDDMDRPWICYRIQGRFSPSIPSIWDSLSESDLAGQHDRVKFAV